MLSGQKDRGKSTSGKDWGKQCSRYAGHSGIWRLSFGIGPFTLEMVYYSRENHVGKLSDVNDR